MLFLNVENQLFLIIALAFSSLILALSFMVRHQATSLRVFELSFAIPLLLTASAFFASPYQKTKAEAFMFFGQLFLVLLCTVVIQVKPGSEALKLFYFIPFALICIALFIARNFLYQELFLGIYILNLIIMLFQLALVIHCLMQKEKKRITAYLGIFTLSVFLGLWLLFGELSLESMLLMVLGYFLCALYVYQNTLKPLFAEHQQHSEALKQKNAHVQMEVIRRAEEVERSKQNGKDQATLYSTLKKD